MIHEWRQFTDITASECSRAYDPGNHNKPTIEFDHILYLQHDKLGNEFAQHVGHVSLRASNFMRDGDMDAIVHPRGCCFRRILRGSAANQDLWVYPPNAAARVARWARPRIST